MMSSENRRENIRAELMRATAQRDVGPDPEFQAFRDMVLDELDASERQYRLLVKACRMLNGVMHFTSNDMTGEHEDIMALVQKCNETVSGCPRVAPSTRAKVLAELASYDDE